MDGDLYSIGATARASGLSVSALRFYDGAGVLVPATVDPATGYRWYAGEQIRAARLVAGLRRVGMPLADVTRALDRMGEPAAVRSLLDAHLRRLEGGLADARRELARVHALLAAEGQNPTRVEVSATDLAAAANAVRFAVGDDPALPMLRGILFEVQDGALRLVATDRYRLAVAGMPTVRVDGPAVRLFAPVALADALRAQSAPAGSVTVTLDAAGITVDGYDQRLAGTPLDVDFPDYRRLLGDALNPNPAHRVTVDVPDLRRTLLSGNAPVISRAHLGVIHPLAVLAVDPAGNLRFGADDSWAADDPRHIAVNREYLLDALDAQEHGQLILELDGPIRPLAIRVPGDEHRFSVLMPVRL